MATIFDILLNQHLESSKNQYCKRYQSQCLNKNNNNNNTKSECKRSIDFLPALDVTDNSDSLVVELELSGVDKNDIDIEIKESILTIQGEKKILSKNNNNNKTSSLPTSTSSNTSSTSSSANDSSTSSPSSTTTTTHNGNKNESTSTTDLPSIEEFEEGDPSITKSTTTTTTTSTSPTPSTPSTTTQNEETQTTIKKKYVLERSSGYFKRYIDLTKILYTLDLSSISTNYTNGLLTITIKKKPDYSNTIKINID